VIDYWFRIDKMPINGYQFGFDFYPQIENVVIEPFSSDLFTAYEFCEVLCMWLLLVM
jgi:hypothetical protein